VIDITLSAIGHSAQYFPSGADKMKIEVNESDTLLDILEKIGVSKELFMFALVNGDKVDLTYCPEEGDEIVLVSPIMGG